MYDIKHVFKLHINAVIPGFAYSYIELPVLFISRYSVCTFVTD